MSWDHLGVAAGELERAQKCLNCVMVKCGAELSDIVAGEETTHKSTLNIEVGLTRHIMGLEVLARALQHLQCAMSEVKDRREENEKQADENATSVSAPAKPSKAWEGADFNACIRDCFKHFEVIQSMALSAVKDSEQGDFMPHMVALGAFLAELRDRLATEIVWDEKQESEAAE